MYGATAALTQEAPNYWGDPPATGASCNLLVNHPCWLADETLH